MGYPQAMTLPIDEGAFEDQSPRWIPVLPGAALLIRLPAACGRQASIGVLPLTGSFAYIPPPHGRHVAAILCPCAPDPFPRAGEELPLLQLAPIRSEALPEPLLNACPPLIHNAAAVLRPNGPSPHPPVSFEAPLLLWLAVVKTASKLAVQLAAFLLRGAAEHAVLMPPAPESSGYA